MHEHEDTPRITLTAPNGVRVQADPDRIAQILGNLLDNALKYGPPGRRSRSRLASLAPKRASV